METAQHHQAECSPPSHPTSQPGISGSFHPPPGLVKAALVDLRAVFCSCVGVQGPQANFSLLAQRPHRWTGQSLGQTDPGAG